MEPVIVLGAVVILLVLLGIATVKGFTVDSRDGADWAYRNQAARALRPGDQLTAIDSVTRASAEASAQVAPVVREEAEPTRASGDPAARPSQGGAAVPPRHRVRRRAVPTAAPATAPGRRAAQRPATRRPDDGRECNAGGGSRSA
ncbi:hypothetical protein [Allostreptomyces psammosilenae]|uniref:Uncharacterized protein n=1 Tax=Allostreptomyces psammosilenae TaxID=1892865 RepID=A0A852ZWS0_9ACTN|nr:hypothetical protein [Allostreptomyces psammosilenae]NYI06843.1 hypothetical protein [Allostreptomyces psammosilenae]